MIRFSDIAEAFEKTDVSENYKNIKPAEKMTDQEVDDFWSSEFVKAQEEVDVYPYDTLLSEAFNRSEDEIAIHINIDNEIKASLDNFSPENWKTMSEVEQMNSIKELTHKVCKQLGLDKIPEISIFEDEGGAYGNYNSENNMVNLNRKYFDDPCEIANTLTHELRHAFQEYRAEILDTWEDALYRVNLENYISPLPLPGGGWLFFTDYMNQYVEVDARAFANLFSQYLFNEAMKV